MSWPVLKGSNKGHEIKRFTFMQNINAVLKGQGNEDKQNYPYLPLKTFQVLVFITLSCRKFENLIFRI